MELVFLAPDILQILIEWIGYFFDVILGVSASNTLSHWTPEQWIFPENVRKLFIRGVHLKS